MIGKESEYSYENFKVQNSFGLNYYLGYYYFNKLYDAFSIFFLTLTSFLIPFMLGHPQFLVGTIVNILLIESSFYLDFKKSLPIILMPSLGALSRSLLFGPFTIFLIYMIPFIWLGNTIFVLTMKFLHFKSKTNVLLSGLLGAGLKSIFLFGSAFLVFKLGLIPKLFLTAFGINQFITASLASFIIYPTILLRKKYFRIRKK